ncbi:MAG: galactose mutarotase [Cytophagales bacterium]|nr:galactose mutarotase [Cytophagales bacterium]
MKSIWLVLGLLATAVSCSPKKKEVTIFPESNFEKNLDGKQVKLFTLKNIHGMVTQITNYGGRVVTLWTSDRHGNMEDIVLGYENIDGYLNSNEIYFGALIGRYGNRIGKGRFYIDDREYTLATNNGVNHLHGGKRGFNDVIWDARQTDGQTLELTYLSKDMEEGYPGNLDVKVIYMLTDNDELKVEYWATTDAPTVVNLTHHSFFNLHGAGNGSINDHVLYINADKYTPVDAGLIPTGKIASVEGTPMDFTNATAIGDRVDNDFEQLKFGMGYDHNWILNTNNNVERVAARITEPTSGRAIEVYTSEPGMQFYGGNFLNGSDKGKYGRPYEHRTAFCLETQHYPDSPNQPNFPATLLKPGETYHSVCIYKFGYK